MRLTYYKFYPKFFFFILTCLIVFGCTNSDNEITKQLQPILFQDKDYYYTKWGEYGSGNGQFNSPYGIAVDNSGNVYVADSGNHCIQKFNSDGDFITKWGENGPGNGQFDFPCGITIDNNGNVYVADTGNDRIQKFTLTGGYITNWGGWGVGDGQFESPRGIAEKNGNIYVTDRDNNRIQKFTSDGVFLLKWGSPGSLNNQFNTPEEIAVDNNENIYIADSLNNRIQKFNSSGGFITKWTQDSYGRLYKVQGITADKNGYIYATDKAQELGFDYRFHIAFRIYTSSGGFIREWGVNDFYRDYDGGEFSFRAIAVGNNGYVYISVINNNCIYRL